MYLDPWYSTSRDTAILCVTRAIRSIIRMDPDSFLAMTVIT